MLGANLGLLLYGEVSVMAYCLLTQSGAEWVDREKIIFFPLSLLHKEKIMIFNEKQAKTFFPESVKTFWVV